MLLAVSVGFAFLAGRQMGATLVLRTVERLAREKPLRLVTKADGVWLHAKNAKGQEALTNLSIALPRGRKGFIDKVLHGVMDDLVDAKRPADE